MIRRSVVLVGLALLAAAAPAIAGRTPHRYRIDAPAVPAGSQGEGLAINAGGAIAGRIDDDAFAWDGRTLRRFAPVTTASFDDPYRARATAINARGTIVGHDGNDQPCSMSGLQLASPAVFRAEGTEIVGERGECSYEIDGVNDAGVMVGIRSYRGFVRYSDGRQIEIQPLSTRPEFNGTHASAIDNEGDVVGGTTIDVPPPRKIPMGESRRGLDGPFTTIYGPDPDAYVVHAFLAVFTRGAQHMRDLGALASRMTDLGAGTAADSYAYGVGDDGTVVGQSGDDAALRLDKNRYDLRTLVVNAKGWTLTCARGINRAGQIVGTGMHDGQLVPFRLTPVR